jgi:hypothetical protein
MADKLKFYFDEHMPRVVAQSLAKQGYVVMMAVDVGMTGKDDDTEHLPFAAAHQAVLVTRDFPFAGRTSQQTEHAGLICWTGAQQDFGGMIRALSEFAEQYTPEEVAGRVLWLK